MTLVMVPIHLQYAQNKNLQKMRMTEIRESGLNVIIFIENKMVLVNGTLFARKAVSFTHCFS